MMIANAMLRRIFHHGCILLAALAILSAGPITGLALGLITPAPRYLGMHAGHSYSIAFRPFDGIAIGICHGPDLNLFWSYPFRRIGPWEAEFPGFSQRSHRLLGFAHIRGLQAATREAYDAVLVPFWFLILVTLPPPLLYFRFLFLARSRRRRLLKGLCLHCGYDLRASKDCCPECGTPISPTAPGGGEIARIF